MQTTECSVPYSFFTELQNCLGFLMYYITFGHYWLKFSYV